MTQQIENKWTVQDLIKNLKRNKDAVVIIGDKAVKELELYQIKEESKKDLSRKKMVKEPKKFWSFYKENIANQNIHKTDAETALNELVRLGVVKTVVNLNYSGQITAPLVSNTNIIELKGNHSKYRCMSCEKEGLITDSMLNTNSVLKCECKGKIAPTITMFGDKYLEKHTKAIKDAIFIEKDNEVKLNTHCLIFIGIDFEEDYIHELIESYNAIKPNVSTDEDPYFTVIITDKDGVSIEYYQPEFATYEDISGSLDRLKDML